MNRQTFVPSSAHWWPQLWSRALTLLVPALLCLIAAAQVLAANYGTLSPWKGGGFGMFGTIDGPTNRFLSVIAVAAGGEEYRVSVPFGRYRRPAAFTSSFMLKLRTMPRRREMLELAQAVLNSHLGPSDTASSIPPHLALSSLGAVLQGGHDRRRVMQVLGPRRTATSVEVRAVRVEVLRVRFDPASQTAQLVTFIAPATVSGGKSQ